MENPNEWHENPSKAELLRKALPALQPQEGSPANTFTQPELKELQDALPDIQIGKHSKIKDDSDKDPSKLNIKDWQSSAPLAKEDDPVAKTEGEQQGSPQVTPLADLDWHGAPKFSRDVSVTRSFREKVRAGEFKGPTNAQCPGFMQCNVVILPQGQHAFDFMLFCQRNPQACPLVEVCDVGSPVPSGVAPGADLRTDIPKYAIYRNGKLDKEVYDATDYWPKDSVAFLIGCSFSYDGALMDAGIPLRNAEQGKNVSMYRTNLKCRPSGSLKGNMVVSMKPIPSLQISKHVEITSSYPHAHGSPVCVGSAEAIGIKNIDKPDWGDSITIQSGDVPVFHACGVTPQNVLMDSMVPFAITHSPGHMFVTDMPSDMGR